MLRLLSRRAELAQRIGAIKGKDDKPFFTPEREREIFERLARENPGPLLDAQLTAIYREIISAARAAEKPLKIAYWGPPGSFTHIAAMKTFGGSSSYTPSESIADSFQEVEHGHADYAVAPIENSLAGVVPETIDMFPRTRVKICAEQYVLVQHHLLSNAASLSEIERVYAGPQPAQQCRRWLREHLPHAEMVEITPTSRAAEKALTDNKGAAIANRLAAEILDMPVLADHIEDSHDNSTRFIVVGFNEPKPTGNDKTSISFSLRNKPGELYRALGAFVENGVNLMMIESRPSQRSKYEYLFYADCTGHHSDVQVKKALDMLKLLCLEVTILGSYPTSERP